jgi:hypothetical protein
MRHTVEGFKQSRLVELGLGYVEAVLLRWLVDFSHTGKMREITDAQGRHLWWVRYDAVAEDVPVLGINAPDVMRRRFARLVTAGVLIHEHVNNRGRFSYYGFGPAYESLIAEVGHSTGKSSEAPEEEDHPIAESSEEPETADHSIVESGETASEPVHSTEESAPIRLFSRLPSDRTVGSNDSSSRDLSSRMTQEEEARARGDDQTGHLPPHMALAVSWYKRLATKTTKLIRPSGEDFIAAQKALERVDAETVLSAIEPYFAQDWWFTKDRQTKKATYSFKSFLAQFPTILGATNAGKSPAGRAPRRCPKCQADLTFGTAKFTTCRCGRALEIDDAGALQDVTEEMVKA